MRAGRPCPPPLTRTRHSRGERGKGRPRRAYGRRARRRTTIRYTINRITAPRNDIRNPAACPGPYRPIARPMSPPTTAPAIPSYIVTMMPPGSRPGITSLASAPTTRPITIHPITVMASPPAKRTDPASLAPGPRPEPTAAHPSSGVECHHQSAVARLRGSTDVVRRHSHGTALCDFAAGPM